MESPHNPPSSFLLVDWTGPSLSQSCHTLYIQNDVARWWICCCGQPLQESVAGHLSPPLEQRCGQGCRTTTMVCCLSSIKKQLLLLSFSNTNSPDTKPEVPGQRSHCLILCHFCCPMMLHQLERRSELENTFLLAWRFEEVHLGINSGDSKEEVYGCRLRSKDLPHLRKFLTWWDF